MERKSPKPQPQMWWGYRHIDGGVHAKPYLPAFGAGDVREAKESPFVARVIGPFMAMGRDDALKLVYKLTGGDDATNQE